MASSKMAGLGMVYQDPEPLVEPELSGEGDYTVTDVSRNDTVYKEISIDFENAGLSVVRIERLSNPHLWKRYVTERDLMIQQRTNIDTDFKLNEKYLYHGTSAEKKYICEDGLDSRMSKQGCFGRGIYFSDYPKKCVKYAEKAENSVFFILLSRVILGVPKVYNKGEKDRNLVREPEKKAPYKGYRFYDSVEGCPVNHREFVIYESRRALVECLITYRKKEHAKALPLSSNSNARAINDNTDDLDSDFSDSDVDLHGGPNDLEGSGSSEDEDNNVSDTEADGSQDRAYKDSPEKLLMKKKREFQKKTGVTDEYIVDHYLLKGHLDVSKAVKLYKERPADGDQETIEEPKLDPRLEEEFARYAPKKPEVPAPGSQQWTQLSEENKEAYIKILIEDFRQITGLSEADDEDYIRKCLSAVNYNLDIAVLAHYEEISSGFGTV